MNLSHLCVDYIEQHPTPRMNFLIFLLITKNNIQHRENLSNPFWLHRTISRNQAEPFSTLYWWHRTVSSTQEWTVAVNLYPSCRPLQIDDHKHDDIIKCKSFPSYWPFVRGIHWTPMDSFTKANNAELWCLFMWTWTKGWSNSRGVGDLRGHGPHFDVIVISVETNVHIHVTIRVKGLTHAK